MSNPIIDYELGKMTHREYEARACGCWGRMMRKTKVKAENDRKTINHKLSKRKSHAG